MSSKDAQKEPPPLAGPPPKKKAGRKKATQDGDAVERRRTQLRLAQRAYRERKESTIAELEKKSANLERALSEVYGIFNEYHQDALASGASAGATRGLVQDLDSVKKRFDTAVQAAGVSISPSGPTQYDARQGSVATGADASDNLVPVGSSRTALDAGLRVQPGNMLGYQFDSDPTTGNLLSMSAVQQQDRHLSQRHQQPLPTQAQSHVRPMPSIRWRGPVEDLLLSCFSHHRAC